MRIRVDLPSMVGCAAICGVLLVLDVVVVVGQYFLGSVLFSMSVFSSFGSMSHYICKASGSLYFK